MAVTMLDMIGDDNADAIRRAMSERRLLHLPGACAIAPDAIFSTDDLEALLLRDGANGDLRVSLQGRTVDAELMGITRKGRLRHLNLRKLTRQGASLILVELQRHLPKLWALACDAERRLRGRVTVSAVASFNHIPALKPHYDEADLIMLQVEGTKLWRFFGEPVDCAKHRAFTLPEEVTATVTMRPGDIVFVPTGLHHQCEADGYSLHFGLWLQHATLKEVVDDLFERHPALLRPLRAALAGGQLEREASALKQELIGHIEDIDVSAWLTDWNGGRARPLRLGLRGDADVDGLDAIASLAVTMVPEGRSGAPFKVAYLQLESTPATRAVLNALSGGACTIGDLLDSVAPEVPPADAREALAALTEKGIVQLSAAAECDRDAEAGDPLVGSLRA